MEDIADGPQAFEMQRFFRVLLEVFPEADDEVVHGPGGGSPGVPPSDFQKFLPGQGFAGVLDEEFQQFGFLAGQLDVALLPAGGQRAEINAVVSKRVDGFFRAVFRPRDGVFLIP